MKHVEVGAAKSRGASVQGLDLDWVRVRWLDQGRSFPQDWFRVGGLVQGTEFPTG